MLRFLTAGESHGKGLVSIIEGIPANISLDIKKINIELTRRQQGYGRGGRMAIEQDEVEFISGLRNSLTLGSPLTMVIRNQDYDNWQAYMDPVDADIKTKKVTAPRPGHADLTGCLKYGFTDVRNVLERSSARETAARVAIGAVMRQLLDHFGVVAASHVVNIGGITAARDCSGGIDAELRRRIESSPVRSADEAVEPAMLAKIDAARQAGDSLGGIFEIVVTGLPVGLGSYVQWDRKLDAKLAGALLSIQAVKGVEFGAGFACAMLPGSEVHDEIFYDDALGYHRHTNNAGGIEGGMSNGQPLVVRCVMKPIPTLYKSLQSVDMADKQPYRAAVERSDVCAVPAAAVVGEAVVLTTLAQVFMEKFGGDSLEEVAERWRQWQSR